MLSKKSFGGIYEDFLKLPMRSMRGNVRDHIASQKNDHGLSYRHYKASQRRSSPKITICEIFGVVRFSTFSTASTQTGRGGTNIPATTLSFNMAARFRGRVAIHDNRPRDEAHRRGDQKARRGARKLLRRNNDTVHYPLWIPID